MAFTSSCRRQKGEGLRCYWMYNAFFSIKFNDVSFALKWGLVSGVWWERCLTLVIEFRIRNTLISIALVHVQSSVAFGLQAGWAAQTDLSYDWRLGNFCWLLFPCCWVLSSRSYISRQAHSCWAKSPAFSWVTYITAFFMLGESPGFLFVSTGWVYMVK